MTSFSYSGKWQQAYGANRVTVGIYRRISFNSQTFAARQFQIKDEISGNPCSLGKVSILRTLNRGLGTLVSRLKLFSPFLENLLHFWSLFINMHHVPEITIILSTNHNYLSLSVIPDSQFYPKNWNLFLDQPTFNDHFKMMVIGRARWASEKKAAFSIWWFVFSSFSH